jgi:hypothetical protein
MSERMVTQLASSGALEAVKRGNVWWIDADAVARRARERRSAGRPLSPPVAWAVIMLASDRPGWEALGRHGNQPRRAREWLNSHALADNAFRLESRARREVFAAHPSELPRLMTRPDVMRTGISAAADIGLHGGRDEAELYAPEDRRGNIVAEHGMQPRPGPVLVRWVPTEIWPHVEGDAAPRVAVLLDLLEHDDPRARREARRALGG